MEAEDSPEQVDLGSVRGELSRTAGVLDSVYAATERLSRGVYGKCSMCGEQIDGETISDEPLSELCFSCGHASVSSDFPGSLAGTGSAAVHDGALESWIG
ncbi:MAG: hypothetical protein ACYDGY_04540 [Acidimicrobiales bacterium]